MIPWHWRCKTWPLPFSAKLQIERMRQIEEQPVQTGSNTCTPNGYDIQFDHVSFSYHSDEGVLSDVSFTAKQGRSLRLSGPLAVVSRQPPNWQHASGMSILEPLLWEALM